MVTTMVTSSIISAWDCTFNDSTGYQIGMEVFACAEMIQDEMSGCIYCNDLPCPIGSNVISFGATIVRGMNDVAGDEVVLGMLQTNGKCGVLPVPLGRMVWSVCVSNVIICIWYKWQTAVTGGRFMRFLFACDKIIQETIRRCPFYLSVRRIFFYL